MKKTFLMAIIDHHYYQRFSFHYFSILTVSKHKGILDIYSINDNFQRKNTSFFIFLTYTTIGDRKFKPRFSLLRELDNVIELQGSWQGKKNTF